jgi:hypothetical protein
MEREDYSFFFLGYTFYTISNYSVDLYRRLYTDLPNYGDLPNTCENFISKELCKSFYEQ